MMCGSTKARSSGGLTCDLMLLPTIIWKLNRASLVAQWVKNLPAVQETWIQILGWEDPKRLTLAYLTVSGWCIRWPNLRDLTLVLEITRATCLQQRFPGFLASC